MASDTFDPAVEKAFASINLDGAQRHVFLCVGPDCCAPEQGLAVWDYLKQSLKSRQIAALRTKAGCLRICSGGPWMLIYPEGIWYGNVTIERCERIVREHLGQGRPIAEWIVKEHPLPGEELID